MQIPGLVALLFGLASLGAAPASDQSQAASGSVATSVKADSLNSAAKAMPIDKFRPPNERPHNFDPRNLGSIHIEEKRDSVCYTMRSYFFRRQDGQAPVPAGMITCTPADILQNRQVSPRPRVRLVPLAVEDDAQ